MPKKYPRRTIYVSKSNWEMVVWLAGQITAQERKPISVSEVLRRLIEEKYHALGGPEIGHDGSQADDADEAIALAA